MVKSITDLMSVSHGINYSMGICKDGSLWAWGHNSSGQLGLGIVSMRETLAQVGEDKDWVMITCGYVHVVGLKQDGSLWAWGSNEFGQLGLGDTTDKHIPTQVGSDKDWVMITCGYYHTVGLKQDGSLWSWGYNNGQLGLGDTTDKHIPTQVGSDKDWVMITCGYNHTVGLKQDGSLWAWGYNSNGQLGLGDSGLGTNRNTPTPVGSDKDWVSITCGHHRTLGLKQDGSLWKWGIDDVSQLSFNDYIEENVPTKIS